MRAIRLAAIGLAVLGVAVPAAATPVSYRAETGSGAFTPDTVLVRFAPGTSLAQRAVAYANAGGHPEHSFKLVDGLELVRLSPGRSPDAAAELYRQNPDVLYAERDAIVRADVIPNDPQFGSLWGLHNTGQSGGAPDADIDAAEAWGVAQGSAEVATAVIDTGVQYDHPDLSQNMFRNAVECAPNGLDDDLNGYVDDCFGIDAYNGDADPYDDNGHGTHVAGTIGAVGDNGVGVVGVNWTARIMGCKFLGAGGSGSISGAVACMDYVKTMKDAGVPLVATSNSWGGGGYSQAMFDAIDAHRRAGLLFIAAAGNSALDNDTAMFYPASYFLPNVISVAATTRTDARAGFSNYGRHTVHLGAPGQDIVSTFPTNAYATLSGTSMATPHVSGVVTLLKGDRPSLDWRALKNLVMAGGDPNGALGSTISGRRLNANAALTCAGRRVQSRLRPIENELTVVAGSPVEMSYVSILCEAPAGDVEVTVTPGGEMVRLLDDGVALDQVSGDGTYSGRWVPRDGGTYSLAFPDGDTLTVRVPDTTPPVITPGISPPANAAGWNNRDVTVSWTISEQESSIASSVGCSPSVVRTETSGRMLTCTAINTVGLSATASQVVRLDNTVPRLTVSETPPPNRFGWNNESVRVTFSCSDLLSGVASCASEAVVSHPGAGQRVAGVSRDVADNVVEIMSRPISIDLVPPDTAITTPGGSVLIPLMGGAIDGVVSDDLSGGAATTVTLTDLAGRQTTINAGCRSECGTTLAVWRAVLPTGLSPGIYTASASSIDRADNSGDASPATLVVII